MDLVSRKWFPGSETSQTRIILALDGKRRLLVLCRKTVGQMVSRYPGMIAVPLDLPERRLMYS